MNSLKDYWKWIAGVLSAILLAIFPDEIKAIAFQNSYVTIALGGSALALGAGIIFWRSHKATSDKLEVRTHRDILPIEAEELGTDIRIVFSDDKIAKDLEDIFDLAFEKEDLSGAIIAENEYHLIENRKKFIRAAIRSRDGRYGGEVLGYYSLFPISLEFFSDLKSGQKSEADITNASVLDPEDKAAEVLYVCEICAIDQEAGKRLILDVKKRCRQIMLANVNIQFIGAWGFTEKGRAIIKAMGLGEVEDFDPSRPFFQISRSKVLSRY